MVYRDSTEIFRPSAAKTVRTVAHPTAFLDDTPPTGGWYYLVCAVDADGRCGGYSARVAVDGSGPSPVPDANLPRHLAITGVAPNPFNPRTTIAWDLPRRGQVRIAVYDLRGRLVRTLLDGQAEAGSHRTVWDGQDRHGRAAAAGIYFVRLSGAAGDRTRKMVLAK